jgi:hypothetical protein
MKDVKDYSKVINVDGDILQCFLKAVDDIRPVDGKNYQSSINIREAHNGNRVVELHSCMFSKKYEYRLVLELTPRKCSESGY